MTAHERLVLALEALPKSDARSLLLARTLMYVYHDFNSSLANPKLALVEDLTNCGFPKLADQVKAGLYDDEPTEAQAREAYAAMGIPYPGPKKKREKKNEPILH